MSLEALRESEALVRRCATRDLLSPAFLEDWKTEIESGEFHPLFGLCAVACCAMYMIHGDEVEPHMVFVEDGEHVFLKERSSRKVLDPTADQFPFALDYSEGFVLPSNERGYIWGYNYEVDVHGSNLLAGAQLASRTEAMRLGAKLWFVPNDVAPFVDVNPQISV
ncbi:MAG: hypothetical protein JSS66_07360 [Armatimonadetes bacterium]|nr:hypothetical protein [Armatimonadota bacterium]